MSQRIYELALYALLHDIGKPFVRFAMRVKENLEDRSEAEKTKSNLMKIYPEKPVDVVLDEIIEKGHVEVSDEIYKYLVGKDVRDVKRNVEEIIHIADKFAASERGFELVRELYNRVKDCWNKVENRVSSELGLGLKYTHYTAPLLSPLWVLFKTNYLDYVGINALIRGKVGEWDVDSARKIFKETISECRDEIERNQCGGFIDCVFNTIKSLIDSEIWLPVKPLEPAFLRDLKGLKLKDAILQSSYAKVVNSIIDMLSKVKGIYTIKAGSSPKVERGFVDTILKVLESTTFTVPSAIYWSLVPDVSLYSHSKLVAAYATSRGLATSIRWLIIDVNQIQKFIAAPVSAAAASRVIRGRSLIVELSLDSLVNYVLELFGGLPKTNILVSEGGVLDVIIPDLQDTDVRVRELEKVADNLSKYLGGIIGFTVVVSKPYGIPIQFEKVFEEIKSSIAVKKCRRGINEKDVKYGGLVANVNDIVGFDSITKEPVISSDEMRLKVDQDSLDYVDSIAGPGKLSRGEVIGGVTHLSLVAGTASRRLAYIIGIHIYVSSRDKVRIPNDELTRLLKETLCKQLFGDAKRLYSGITSGNVEFPVGVIPFIPSGSIYILVSIPSEAVWPVIVDVEDENTRKYLEDIKSTLLKTLSHILEKLKESIIVVLDQTGVGATESNLKFYISIEAVNAPHDFIPTYSGVTKVIADLLNLGPGRGVDIDLALGFRYIGSYHPVWFEKDKGRFRLADLDPYEIIAVSKMDVDMFGKVKELFTIYPSRLVTLSDLVNTVVASKTFFHAIHLMQNLSKTPGEPKVIDVIPLYAGGDDLVVYGKWGQVIRYMMDVYKGVRDVLKPLTLSLGISIGRSTEPLLILYTRSLEMLEKAKKVKASATIDIGAEHLSIIKCFDKGYIVSNVLLLEDSSPQYPAPWDEATSWNLGRFSKEVLDVFTPRGGGEKILDELEEYKRDLHVFAVIGNEFSKIIVENYSCKPLDQLLTTIDRATVLQVMYSYLWARRGGKPQGLSDLKKILEKRGFRLLEYPSDIVGKTTVLEALRTLLVAKPYIDLILLALRRREAIEPSNLNI